MSFTVLDWQNGKQRESLRRDDVGKSVFTDYDLLIQRVPGDGSCAIRSLACSLLYFVTGYNFEGGLSWHTADVRDEVAICDHIQGECITKRMVDILALWIRYNILMQVLSCKSEGVHYVDASRFTCSDSVDDAKVRNAPTLVRVIEHLKAWFLLYVHQDPNIQQLEEQYTCSLMRVPFKELIAVYEKLNAFGCISIEAIFSDDVLKWCILGENSHSLYQLEATRGFFEQVKEMEDAYGDVETQPKKYNRDQISQIANRLLKHVIYQVCQTRTFFDSSSLLCVIQSFEGMEQPSSYIALPTKLFIVERNEKRLMVERHGQVCHNSTKAVFLLRTGEHYDSLFPLSSKSPFQSSKINPILN